MTRYTVNKTGTFPIKFGKGSKCGMGMRKFAFSFKVTTKSLDTRSFVLDHFEVEDQLKIQFKGTYNGSCEQLAVSVGKVIAEYIHRNSAAHPGNREAEIEVTLTGADSKSGASVTVESNDYFAGQTGVENM